MTLNFQDIQAILKIIDDTPYDELQIETNDFNLHLKRNENDQWSQNHKTLTAAQPLSDPVQESTEDYTNENQNNQDIDPVATEEGLIDIRAPMIGTFYRSPKPGAECFISVGSTVEENTIIAIIEVMKLMSSIPATLKGEVREILVEDAQLVNKGQLIMRVKPD